MVAPLVCEFVYKFPMSRLALCREATLQSVCDWVNADLCCKSALSSYINTVHLRFTNMDVWLTWSSDEIRCRLYFWADDHIARQLGKKKNNDETMKAPSWLLLMCFGLLEILPV